MRRSKLLCEDTACPYHNLKRKHNCSNAAPCILEKNKPIELFADTPKVSLTKTVEIDGITFIDDGIDRKDEIICDECAEKKGMKLRGLTYWGFSACPHCNKYTTVTEIKKSFVRVKDETSKPAKKKLKLF